MYRQRKEDKKAVLPPLVSDVELATLREIPRGNFVQSNALYASTLQNDSDDSTLPKIRREQITLAKFLGSGAFGEVSDKFYIFHEIVKLYRYCKCQNLLGISRKCEGFGKARNYTSRN